MWHATWPPPASVNVVDDGEGEAYRPFSLLLLVVLVVLVGITVPSEIFTKSALRTSTVSDVLSPQVLMVVSSAKIKTIASISVIMPLIIIRNRIGASLDPCSNSFGITIKTSCLFI